MEGKKRTKKYLAGLLSMVMILSMAMGNISLASEGVSENTPVTITAEQEQEKNEVTQDSGSDNPTVQEPTAGEPTTEEPTVEEPTTEEPITNESVNNDAPYSDEGESADQDAGEVSTYSENLLAAKGVNVSTLDKQGSKYKTVDYNTLKNSIDSVDNDTIAITDWKRSDEEDGQYITRAKNTNTSAWTWNDVKSIGLGLPGDDNVWDGSRLKNGKVSHISNKYLNSNQVTASNGILYDSATWRHRSSNTDKVTIHRFQGSLKITGNPNGYNYTIEPVVPSDEIFINDNMYVFVYPKDMENKITNQNYMEYLAFWTGTISYSDNGDRVNNFHGRTNTKAVHRTNSVFGLLTDQWNTPASADNAGGIITKAYNTIGATEFVVDVFTEDFAEAGGMYRLQVKQQETTRVPLQFYKVDSTDTTKGLEGATFELVNNDTQITYYANSNKDGLVSVDVVPGTYTMQETQAPANYKESSDTWTVIVGAGGNIKISSNQTDLKKNNSGYYYITNESDIKGSLNFSKIRSDETGLDGVTFTLYESDGTTEIGSGTSDADGNVTIANIPIGNGYILKETSTPSGYVALTDSWIVDVAADGTTTMYLAGDKTKTPVTKIINYTKGEEAINNIEQDKTISATSEQYANRTYTINLSASSTGNIVAPGKEANIVLVLDGSGSMGYSLGNTTRAGAVGNSIRTFVSEIAKISENSNVAIVEYKANNSDGTLIQDFTSVKDLQANNQQLLNSAIIRYINSVGGGTYPAYGLKKAYNMLSKIDGDKTTRHAILLCDGAASSTNGLDTQLKNIKSVATLHGIGFALGSSGSGTFSTIQKWVSGSGGAYKADNQEELIKVFAQLVSSTVTPNEVTGATITDVLDSRFELTNEQRNKLEKDKNVVINDNEDGTTTITWNNQTIKAKKESGAGWEAKLEIKAKDEFIGGNVIPTNAAGSGITADGAFKEFDKPTVNVKLLNMASKNEEATVFIQDSITPNGLINNIKDNFSILGDREAVLALPTDCQLSDEEIANLVNGVQTSIVKNYSYGSTQDIVGNFIYTYKTVQGNKDTHAVIKKGTHVEDYKISVVYSPILKIDREEAIGSGYDEAIGTEVTASLSTDAHYYINAVAGQIEITKKLADNTSTNPSLEGDAVFTFKIECNYTPLGGTPSTDVLYRTVRLVDGSGKSINEVKAEILKDLPRGTYKITELKSQRYNVQSITGNGANAQVNGTDSITFNFDDAAIGTVNTDIVSAEATFTNKKTDDTGKRTDTDVVMNRFTKNEDGTWTISQEKVPQTTESSSQNSSEENVALNLDLEAIKVDNFVLPESNVSGETDN